MTDVSRKKVDSVSLVQMAFPEARRIEKQGLCVLPTDLLSLGIRKGVVIIILDRI